MTLNITDYGAVADEQTLNTNAIHAAIEACDRRGGGTVLVPPGRYVTGSLYLRDNITLHLEAGAVLVGSEDPADYPIVHSRWEGADQLNHAPLITGNGLRNVAVTGRGTIDGQGAGWWQRHRDKTLDYPRPRLISFADCRITCLVFSRTSSRACSSATSVSRSASGTGICAAIWVAR